MQKTPAPRSGPVSAGSVRRVLGAATLAALLAGAVAAQEVEIAVSGDNEALEEFLADVSILSQLPEEAVAQDYVAAARAEYRNLLTALYAKAYYGAAISIRIDGQEAAGIEPLDAPGRIGRIAVRVDPGPRYVFGQARIAPLAPGTELPAEFARGEQAEAEIVRQAALAGVEGWRAVGHAKADVADQEIVARHGADRIDASVTLAPGPQLTFGPLIVEGNENVRTAAIQNIVGLPTGEVFSPEELEAAARRLRQTGAFDSVAVREGEIGPGDTLPITFVVAEALPRRIGAGIEYSTVEGLALSAYWMHRNAFGAAERFRIEGEVSGLGGGTGGTDYSIATSLTIPAIYGPHLDLLATASVQREDEPDYLLDKATAEIELVRRIGDDLTVTGGVGWLTAREETAFDERRYTLLTLPVSATLDRRDDPANADNGYYIDVEATPFFGLDGTSDGARVYLDGRGYISFGEDDRFTLAVRGQVGSVLEAPRDEVPVDFLFFSGGSGTVRGQEYKSLGLTETAAGEEITVGGMSFAGAQLEARYGVTEAIGVVGFYDVGYVGATSVPLEDGDWHSGVGIGVRYDTGIGPIRLDVATPADGEDAFGRVEVYIGIGQAF